MLCCNSQVSTPASLCGLKHLEKCGPYKIRNGPATASEDYIFYGSSAEFPEFTRTKPLSIIKRDQKVKQMRALNCRNRLSETLFPHKNRCVLYTQPKASPTSQLTDLYSINWATAQYDTVEH
ncbi:hypothetical protein YC2023_104350 [Brassica napus]